jgi:hypothetical protein
VEQAVDQSADVKFIKSGKGHWHASTRRFVCHIKPVGPLPHGGGIRYEISVRGRSGRARVERPRFVAGIDAAKDEARAAIEACEREADRAMAAAATTRMQEAASAGTFTREFADFGDAALDPRLERRCAEYARRHRLTIAGQRFYIERIDNRIVRVLRVVFRTKGDKP